MPSERRTWARLEHAARQPARPGARSSLSSSIVPTGTIELRLTGDAAREGWLQPFAGGLLWCDRPVGRGGSRAPAPSAGVAPSSSGFALVYDGPGLVAGGMQRIRSFVAADGTRKVEFEDGETFLIAAAGDRIARLVATAAEAPAQRTLERALGAPMALALALRGIFLLHASALAGPRGVIAICGESGTGKSTLASAAASWRDLGLSRVADDQLPVALGARPTVLPHFPQLKLPPEAWHAPGAAAVLPLRMVVQALRSAPAGGDSAPPARIEPLRAAQACLFLAGATVAARLFDRQLLTRHLEACAAASESLYVCRLRYASGLDRLREPLAALAASLARLDGS